MKKLTPENGAKNNFPPLVFVDVETTGMNAARGHIIEMAALKIEHNQIVQEFRTLVNPGVAIPTMITNITGISDSDVYAAPSFADIADELWNVLDGAVFVAHNVRFDYSFLMHEFRRVGKNFHPKMICTVKLSRVLYPGQRRHRLADLIEAHGFTYDARHRAYDDAFVLVQFWQKIQQNFDSDTLLEAINRQQKLPALPQHIEPEIIRNLPEKSGVYIFEDEHGAALYIGKSVNIRRRVMSHFTADTEEYREFKMSRTVRHVNYIETSGELSALLLESDMIKKQMPMHNRRLRRLRKLTVTRKRVDKNGYINLSLEDLNLEDIDSYSSIVAMHPRRSAAKQSLLRYAQTFDLCPKFCGLEKAKNACFSYQLGKCRGACIGKETANSYNFRLEIAYKDKGIDAWPHDGAVIIYEQDDQNNTQTGYIVDNWVITAMVSGSEYSDHTITPYEGIFDLDAYQILRSYLYRYPERVIIQPYHGEFEI